MPSLTIKGLPEQLLDRLRGSAAANRRSLNSEVLYRLEQSVQYRVAEPEELLVRLRALRARTSLPPLTDAALKRMRSEGRT